MGYFSDLIDTGLVQRDVTMRGKSVPTWWRQLTAGQRVDLLRGQTVRSDAASGSVMEVDLAASAERNQRLVVMTLADEAGRPLYCSLKELQAEPAQLVDLLVAMANEVHRDEGNA